MPLQRFPTPDVEEETPKLTLASREAMESIFIPHIVGKYRIEVSLEYGLVALLASILKPRRASELKNENVNITRENTQLKRDLEAGHGKSKRLKVDLKELKREIARNKVKSTRVCTNDIEVFKSSEEFEILQSNYAQDSYWNSLKDAHT
ncbi:hypothetical protein Fot_06351 [Forsythia ovata]|uniref:Uncharacterized protein n=1 Tax=Forsythia ovata TaxID=205694 RepID=A0ABD1WSQ2_9LAMI